MISLHEALRLASYSLVGLTPIFLMFIGLFFNLNPFSVLFILMFITMIMSLVAFIWTSNPLSKIVSGQQYGVLTFDSKGHIQIYSATIVGGNFLTHINGQEVQQKFNRNLFWYVNKVIKKGVLRQKEENQETKIVFETAIDEQNISNAIFKTDYPFLVYSTELKTFITKEWLFKREFDSLLLNFGWELKKSIDEHNKAAGGITRWILDLIAAKSKNPQTQKYVMILIAVVVGVLVLILFGPYVYNLISSASSGTNAVNDIVSTKLT